jgi:hypothetical protein
MNIVKHISHILLCTLMVTSLFAYISPEYKKPVNTSEERVGVFDFRSNCQPGRAQVDQDINNVRARLTTGGDVWWDQQNGLYIYPKPAPGEIGVAAIFAGGVWIGGVNLAGATKLAGVTYRSQTNNFDWYPGPLDEGGATEFDQCRDWDRFFPVLSTDIFRHVNNFIRAELTGQPYDCDSIPDDVKYWPGQGNPYWREKFNFDLPDQSLGAFWDEDGDGLYDPCKGDFPNIEIRGCGAINRMQALDLVPDQMFFWIYNDAGGPHRLTAGPAIQMEVQVQAFAYNTNDEINDMTFQRYKLINKANEDLVDCYFAMWVDPDLGCYVDDYIGCDVERSLAYVYNEDALDGLPGGCACAGVPTYCDKIPLVGIDYFRGPRGPKVFRRNSAGDIIFGPDGEPLLVDPPAQSGLLDTLVELGMTTFIYMNNAGIGGPDPQTTDPQGQDVQFYNYLRGFWRDGTPLTFGGTGFNPGSTDTVRYALPGEPNNPAAWSMCTVDLGFGDRRTLQATGPLLLQPGAINELIIGVVAVPDVTHPCPDITRLQFADDIAQALFDNCFNITDGPDAPDMCAAELDRELILILSNDTIESNNAFEQYAELDLQAPESAEDNLYRFEGYKIYQLADAGVAPQELSNIDRARLIYQVDLKNGVGEIFNWSAQVNPLESGDGEIIWTFRRMVNGADEGIRNTFQVVEDQFAQTDRRLVNHKRYHFMVLAYAYNNYEDFQPRDGIGQRRPYLEGRRNVKAYSFTPRPIVYGEQRSTYAQTPVVTRIEGAGNFGSFLELEDGLRDAIIDGSFDGRVVYKEGAGPLDIKIFNPLEIQDGKFRLEMTGNFLGQSRLCQMADGGRWRLTDLQTNEVIASNRTLDEINEQLMYRRGFSVSINHGANPGAEPRLSNGAVGQTITYADPAGPQWFQAIPDAGGGIGEIPLGGNILSPVALTSPQEQRDPLRRLSRMGNGFFFPFALARFEPANPDLDSPFYISPAWREGQGHSFILNPNVGFLRLRDLNNVDIVFTSDKSKWSRCIVVETASPDYYNGGLNTVGNTRMMDVRESPSLDRDGNPDGTGTGFSWFPGYAVDIETGKRLNIFFGENSYFNDNQASWLPGGQGIGADMVFNPSSSVIAFDAPLNDLRQQIFAGGQHYIYVTRQEYDGCAELGQRLRRTANFQNKWIPMASITWTSVALGRISAPMLSMADGLVPNDAIVNLRVSKRYSKERNIRSFEGQQNDINNCRVEDPLPIYEFEFKDAEVRALETDEYAGALANVNVVPNPYYAYSAYENSQFVNTVRITNLPERAIVTIYSLDGNFIRRFNRDERPIRKVGANPGNNESQILPSLDWDLRNAAQIPVGSGVYLIHIQAPDLGEERVLKFFCINRQFDPSGL